MVPRIYRTLSRDRRPEDLIRNAKAHQNPVQKSRFRVHLLAQCTAHQKIPRIRHQNNQRHLNIWCTCTDNRKFRIFPCGRMI